MNAGAELALRLSRHFGVGTRMRFIRGSVKFDSPDGGTVPVEVGGVQLAARDIGRTLDGVRLMSICRQLHTLASPCIENFP